MFVFLSSNWLWIMLIGGMLFMYLGRGHGGHMGCGGHQHSGSGHEPADEPSASDRPADPHKHQSRGCH